MGDWFWYQVWLIFTPGNSIQIIIGLITLGIALFTYKSAKAASDSAKAASDSAKLTQEMLSYESKPFIAYNGKFNSPQDDYICNIEGTTYHRERLFFTNYGKGAALLRKPELTHPDLKADIGIPITLGQGAETYITIYLPKTETAYETDLTLFYWNTVGVCYCTIFKCKIKHAIFRGDMLRIKSEEVKEMGIKEMPPEINNWV
jgi:hypothetical protein